jgi:hypothetical protein
MLSAAAAAARVEAVAVQAGAAVAALDRRLRYAAVHR